MDTEDEYVLPAEFRGVSVNALRETSRRKLAGYLDLEGSLVVVGGDGAGGDYNMEQDVVNNYNGLAELAGLDYQTIRNLQRKESPTKAFLEQWNGQRATIGNLWQYLFFMERVDVLKACRNTIFADCRLFIEHQEVQRNAEMYDILQDQTVSNSEMKIDETKFSTTDDIITGKKTYYDAFICYTTEDEQDRVFVREIIKHLEVERGLKLFIPGRNDIPGAAEHTINAYLIEERCRRVVILMSKTFLQSQVCDFQVKFAHALAPGARSKKLIPIIRQKGTVIPRILRFLAVCDFTKTDMLEWVWDRLYTAIIAPVGPVTYFEEEDDNNPFTASLKEISFPAVRRLDDEEERQVRANRNPQPVPNQAAGGAASVNRAQRPGVGMRQNNEPVEHSFNSGAMSQPLQSTPQQGANRRQPEEHSFQSTNSSQISSSRSTERFV